jgi:hypothetical protein
MDKTGEKRGPGRPRKPPKTKVNFQATLENKAWLERQKNQGLTITENINRMIDRSREEDEGCI